MTATSDARQLQIRLSPELHERLRVAADERDVSVNWLAVRALTEFVDRLIPADEIRWTRETRKDA